MRCPNCEPEPHEAANLYFDGSKLPAGHGVFLASDLAGGVECNRCGESVLVETEPVEEAVRA